MNEIWFYIILSIMLGFLFRGYNKILKVHEEIKLIGWQK